MRILKFGGSSVATADRIARVVEIVHSARTRGEVAVVVSAFGGVTDGLSRAAEAARSGADDVADRVAELRQRHLDMARELALPEELGALEAETRSVLAQLEEFLQGVSLLGEASPRVLDRVLACGELLSASLVAAALRRGGLPAIAADARALIVTDANFGHGRPDPTATRERVQSFLEGLTEVPVITGFIAATVDGETTTLGRGGSDFTV